MPRSSIFPLLRRSWLFIFVIGTLLLVTVRFHEYEPLNPQREIVLGTRSPLRRSNRITILSVYHDRSPMYIASQDSHKKYARIHGCDYRIKTFDFMKQEKEYPFKFYNKIAHIIRVILKVMEEGEEWIFWTDADTFITNPAIPLETFLPPSDLNYTEASEPFMLKNADFNGLNCGVIFIRANMWSVNVFSRTLLDPVLLKKKEHVINDQASLSRLLFNEKEDIALYFWEIPQLWLNEYDPEGHWEKTLQTHLVADHKNRPLAPLITQADKVYAEANNDRNLLMQQPSVAAMREEARLYWQQAKPGDENMKFMLEG